MWINSFCSIPVWWVKMCFFGVKVSNIYLYREKERNTLYYRMHIYSRHFQTQVFTMVSFLIELKFWNFILGDKIWKFIRFNKPSLDFRELRKFSFLVPLGISREGELTNKNSVIVKIRILKYNNISTLCAWNSIESEVGIRTKLFDETIWNCRAMLILRLILPPTGSVPQGSTNSTKTSHVKDATHIVCFLCVI